jgi:integrase
MFDLAIVSKPRGYDLAKIKVGDLVAGVGSVRGPSSSNRRPVDRSSSSCSTVPGAASWLGWSVAAASWTTLFSRAGLTTLATSATQYARLVGEWVKSAGLRREDYGTHSLRRTKAALIYKQTGNLRAVQILLGHTKIESTVRYRGVDIEDALTLAEHTEV